MKKILLILLDGVADRVDQELGGLTPLEAALTPNLDRIARLGASALMYPLGPGLAVPSELPHFHLFGYADDPFPGRAVLEALGWGVEPPRDIAVTHLGLRHVTPGREGYAITNWWPGSEDEDARRLVPSIERYEAEGLSLQLGYLGKSDSLLIIGGGSEAITDSDPFFHTGHPILRIQALEEAVDPDLAVRTARVLNAYLLWSHGVLEEHAVNRERRARGAAPLNMPVSKWSGRWRPLPVFESKAGLTGSLIASTRMYAGLAAALGMTYVSVSEHADDPAREMAEKLAAAFEAFAQGAGFVHLHTKLADEAAHSHSPTAKRDVIAALDRGLAGLWTRPHLLDDYVIAVTADHTTPSRGPMLHTGDSVPLSVAASTIRPDSVNAFGERAAAGGGLGQLQARDVLPVLLNAANRARFLGARSMPQRGMGHGRVAPLLPPGN
jgi:2,3-bisphosphoglycerate-independent phosphoglycerate mutase